VYRIFPVVNKWQGTARNCRWKQSSILKLVTMKIAVEGTEVGSVPFAEILHFAKRKAFL
jgi:hypothetical protein